MWPSCAATYRSEARFASSSASGRHALVQHSGVVNHLYGQRAELFGDLFMQRIL
jgi:hypothetical protein